MSENIDTGMILEALNDKVDRDCRNVDTTSGADAVIEYQIPTAENNYTWYRLYKSGWIEQGGRYGDASSYIPADTTITVTFVKEMANTNYSLLNMFGGRSGTSSVTNAGAAVEVIANRTTTSAAFNTDGIYANFCNYLYWEVKGMSAQS